MLASCRTRFRPLASPGFDTVGRPGRQQDGAVLARQAGIQEADLRDGVRQGGRVQGALAVVRAMEKEPEIVVYLRVSWTLGYHILRRWRGKGDRLFRTADAALQAIWRHGYCGPVVVYLRGDTDLARFRGVLPQDRSMHDSKKAFLGADARDDAPAAANLKRVEQRQAS